MTEKNNIEKNEIRIGVFICRCGLNIAKSIDTTALATFAEDIEDVVHVNEIEFSCSDIGQEVIIKDITENNLNRVVIAGCSPWLHENTFQKTLEKAGLNKYLLEMANIREHVALLYPGQVIKATEKAKHILKAAIERSRTLESIDKLNVKINQSVLIIGGGVSGTEAAKRLGDLGINTFLVEKTPFVGGKVLQLGSVFPTDDCGTCTGPCENELHRRCFYRSPIAHHPYVHILTNTSVKELKGHVGRFKAVLETKPRYINLDLCMSCGRCAEVCPQEVPNEFNYGMDKRKAAYILSDQALPRVYAIDEGSCTKCGNCVDACPTQAIDLNEEPHQTTIDIGSVIVSTGFELFDAKGMFGFGEIPDVIDQLHLARMLDLSGPTNGKVVKPSNNKEPRSIVMIQCVGSRDPKTNEYCSKICCGIAVKHAVDVAKRYPNSEITIIHKDIRLTGKYYEDYYYEAEDLGINLLRGEVLKVNNQDDGTIKVDIENEFGEHTSMDVDLVVLSTGLEPSRGTHQIAETLGLKLSRDNFLAERGPKVEPLDTSIEGIFIAGTAHGPKDIQESVTQAIGASSRVASILIPGEMEIDRAKAVVDIDTCVGCGACASACPFNAIEWKAFGHPEVIEEACESCGICAAVCPVSAMQLKHYKDDQLVPKIKGIMTPKWINEEMMDEPVILVFACKWCSYAAADAAGSMGMEYPDNIRIIKVPCTGRVDALHILSAFKYGADGVMISGCMPDQCNYIDGNLKALDRSEITKKVLDVLEIGGERLETVFTTACMPTWLVSMFKEFTERITKINEKQGTPKIETLKAIQ
jgi:heterodisulfide reductase subunit A